MGGDDTETFGKHSGESDLEGPTFRGGFQYPAVEPGCIWANQGVLRLKGSLGLGW